MAEVITCSQEKSDRPTYKNLKLSAEERAKDLLSRMTLQEKVAQMHGVWNDKAILLLDSYGHFDIKIVKEF